MTKTVFQIVLFIFFFTNTAFAQKSSIQLGTQIPLLYSIGYEFDIGNRISLNTQIRILTKPYDVAILEILKLSGSEESLVNTIGEAFKSKSKLTSEFGDVSTASSLIDNELDYCYVNYGYLPSFNIYIVKNIAKQKDK